MKVLTLLLSLGVCAAAQAQMQPPSTGPSTARAMGTQMSPPDVAAPAPVPVPALAPAPAAASAPVAVPAAAAAPSAPARAAPAATAAPARAPLPQQAISAQATPQHGAAPPPAPAMPPVSNLPGDAPKVVITGGVYSETREMRAAIVNGEVVREGASLGPGLVLEQIRPQGVVLAYRGARYTVIY